MLQIETERDIERLRQVALLQEAEIHRLLARLAEFTRQLAEARGEDVVRALQLELTVINEQLAARNRALYGTSSERRARGDAGNAGKAKKAPSSGHPRRAQRDLPIVEVVHELDEADKACPKCGGDLAVWAGQFETADEIDVIERSFRIVRHQRQKYRCGCGECDRDGARAAEAGAWRALLGRLRDRGGGGEVSGPHAARTPGAADGA